MKAQIGREASTLAIAAWRRRQLVASLLAMATLCFSCANQRNIKVKESSDELLRSLAALAREGERSICDPLVLESRLKIKIDSLIDRSRKTVDGHDIVEMRGEVVQGQRLGSAQSIVSGMYVKFKSDQTSFCHLGFHLSEQFSCDMDSEQTQLIMGARVHYLGDTIHSPGRPIVYAYAQKNEGEVQVRWETPTKAARTQ